MSLYRQLTGKSGSSTKNTSGTQTTISLYRRLKTDEEEEEKKASAAATSKAREDEFDKREQEIRQLVYKKGLKELDEKYKGMSTQAKLASPEYQSELARLAKSTGYYTEPAERNRMYSAAATESALPYLGEKAKIGLMEFGRGLSALSTVGKSSDLSKTPSLAQRIQAMQSEDLAKFAEAEARNVPKGMKLAGDIVQGAAGRVPSIMMSAVNPTMGLQMMGLSAAGSSAQEAMSQGASKAQALAYGGLSGAIEVGTEYLFGGIPFMKGVGDKVTESVVKPIKNRIIRTAISKGLDGIGEAVEEIISGALDPYARRITFDPDAETATAEDLLYEGAIGFGVSALLGLPGTIVDAIGRTQKTITGIDSVDKDGNIVITLGDDSHMVVNPSKMSYEDLETLKSYLPDVKNKQLSKPMREVKKVIDKAMSAKEVKNEQVIQRAAAIKEARSRVSAVAEAPASTTAKVEQVAGIGTAAAATDTTAAKAAKVTPAETSKMVETAPSSTETGQSFTYKVGDTVRIRTGDITQEIKLTSVRKSTVEGTTEDGKHLRFTKQTFEERLRAATEQEKQPDISLADHAAVEEIEKEIFGEVLPKKINLQLFAEKVKTARERLLEEFKKEKEAIRWYAKEKRAAALEKLSQKYEAKIEKLNKLLDAEKYKNFWKSELDKKDFREKIAKLREEKNAQIAEMKKQFSEKLKETKKEYTLKKYEAVGKLKLKMKDKAAAEKAKAREQAEINKKLQQLRKIDIKHMRPEYKRQVEALLSALDITAKAHTQKKLAVLAKMKQYIEANPDHNIPDHVLKQLDILSKKTVSELTKDEFDDIYNSVMHLVHLEKMKNRLIMKGRYREAAEVAAEATANVLRNRQIKTDPTAIDTSKPEMSKNFVKEFFLNHLNPETLTIMSDQESDGVIKKILFDDMYEGHNNELKYKHDAYAIFKDFLDGLGGEIRSWSRSFNKKLAAKDLVEIPISKQKGQDITKIRITKAERIYLYLAFKDKDALRSILKGGVSFGNNLSQVVRLTPEDIKTIKESMTKEELQFADLAEKYFLDYARPLMNEVFLELNGYELIPERKGYVPIKRHQDFLDRDYLKMKNKTFSVSLEGMGLLKERVKASSPIVADDIFRTLVEHIEKIGAYYGLAKPLRNAKMLLENPRLKNAYRQTGMYGVYQQLKKYIDDVETGSADLEFLDRLSHKIRSKFATSVLGANPFTILKQFSAYILETNEIPAKYLMKAQFTKSAIDEIVKYSPILAERVEGNISLELGEIGKIAQMRKLFGNYKDIPQLLTKGMVKADRQIIAKTWNAVKMMLQEQNPSLSGEELLTMTARKTEEVIRHTNSAATMYDRSAIGRSKSEFTKALTMFTSQTNIMFNQVVRAVMEYNQGQKTAKDFKKVTKKLVTTLVLANLVEQAIDQLRLKITGKGDDEEEGKWDIVMDIVEGILNQVYFVGKIFSAYRSNVKYGKYFGYDLTTPEFQVTKQLIDYVTDITTVIQQVASKERYKSGPNKGKLKWKKTLQGLVDETFSILAKFTGIPYDTPKKIVEGIVEKVKD